MKIGGPKGVQIKTPLIKGPGVMRFGLQPGLIKKNSSDDLLTTYTQSLIRNSNIITDRNEQQYYPNSNNIHRYISIDKDEKQPKHLGHNQA